MKSHNTTRTDLINDVRDAFGFDEFCFEPLRLFDVALLHVAVFGGGYFGTRLERAGVKDNYSKALKIIEQKGEEDG